MTNEQKIKQLDRILDEVGVYHRAVGKLGFDMKLAVRCGETVTLTAEGEREDEAVEAAKAAFAELGL